jgi:hypothetical protein
MKLETSKTTAAGAAASIATKATSGYTIETVRYTHAPSVSYSSYPLALSRLYMRKGFHIVSTVEYGIT